MSASTNVGNTLYNSKYFVQFYLPKAQAPVKQACGHTQNNLISPNMANLVGSQQVHLAATVEGRNPTSGAFPACGAITPLTPFPQSPSPVYTLIAGNVVGGPYPYSSLNYPKANCAVEVQYFVGSTRQTSTILLIETYAAVVAGWS